MREYAFEGGHILAPRTRQDRTHISCDGGVLPLITSSSANIEDQGSMIQDKAFLNQF